MYYKRPFENVFCLRVRNSIKCECARSAALSCGDVLLVTTEQPASAQTYQVIYSFTGGASGGGPAAGLTLDRAGNLYGVTSYGGSGN